MTDPATPWNGEAVRTWLDSRLAAALGEQARADRHGRGHEDDYDKAAAEEWVCRATRGDAAIADRQRFAALLKDLIGREDYARPGVHDDRRFQREVRAYLRRLARMTKSNTGFGNLFHHQ